MVESDTPLNNYGKGWKPPLVQRDTLCDCFAEGTGINVRSKESGVRDDLSRPARRSAEAGRQIDSDNPNAFHVRELRREARPVRFKRLDQAREIDRVHVRRDLPSSFPLISPVDQNEQSPA